MSEEAKIERLYAKALKEQGALSAAKERYAASIAIFEKLGREKDVVSVKAELSQMVY